MTRRRILLCCVFAIGGLGLSGCMTGTALLDTYGAGIFREDNTNMTERNYGAADYLVQQAGSYMKNGKLVKALPMRDVEEPVLTAKIGRIIPEQVGIRLAQLGYNVDVSEVSSSPESDYLRGGGAPDFTLSGTYQRKGQDLIVHLRITQVHGGNVVGAFDYSMPMDYGMADMAKPQTRIYKP